MALPGNPPIPRLLWGLTALEALVVALAGGILFSSPNWLRPSGRGR